MYAPERVAAPAAPPVSLADAKAHLRIETDDENALIDGLIGSATDHLDGWSGILGRCLVTQSWRQRFDRFCSPLRLALPALAITSVANGEDTVAGSVYELLRDQTGSFLGLKPGQSWPSVAEGKARVAVTFTAGYGAAADVPPALKAAVLIMVGHLYDNRGGSNQGLWPPAVNALIAPYRRVGV